MKNISAVIIARNNSHNINETLQTLGEFEEVLVIDCGSTDNTADLAAKAGAHVTEVNLSGKELALAYHKMLADAPRNEWVLLLYPGERVPEGLHAELQRLADNDEQVLGYYVPRKDFMLSKFIKCTYPAYSIRFFKRDAAYWTHHSLIEPTIEGKTGHIPATDEHLAIIRPGATIKSIFQRINEMSDIEMEQMRDKPVSGLTLVFAPFARFVAVYLGKGSWRFGTAGLIQAVFESFHNFTVNAKIYERRKTTSLK